MSNPNFGTTGLLASTIENWIPTLVDQIFTSKPLMYALETSGSIVDHPGGTSIVQELIYGESANVGSYSDYDVFTTDPNSGLSAAEFPWRQFYGLFHYSGLEDAMNSGEAQMLRLLESRGKQLKLSMGEEIERQLFDDGSGNGDKDFDGLAAIVSNANPSWGNLGGIDRVANSYWRSTATSFAAAALSGLVAAMTTMWNTVSSGSEHPSILMGSQAAFEGYEGQLVQNARYQNMEMGDAGFQNLLFKGVPFTFSEYADYGFTNSAVATAKDPIWFLNLDYLELAKLASKWFKPTGPRQPVNQDATYESILSYGNLVTSNPSRQGVLYRITV